MHLIRPSFSQFTFSNTTSNNTGNNPRYNASFYTCNENQLQHLKQHQLHNREQHSVQPPQKPPQCSMCHVHNVKLLL